jgi:3-hydroxyacyl-[acyl-carrier-protein] dehydratase
VATTPAGKELSAEELDTGEPLAPMLTHHQVRGFLKQRFPLLMVDTVLSIEPHVRVVAVKNVSGNELHFLGHLPDFPLMPGALIIESLAQTAAFLGWGQGTGSALSTMQYLGSANVQFFKPVFPGDQMVNEVRQVRQVANMQIVSVISRVRQQVMARGELFLATKENTE